MSTHYCESPYRYRRRKTRPVVVGEGPQGPVVVGGGHPIRVQSMTTTPTRDTEATVAQVVRLIDAGCEIVRITAPKVKDAENLREIRASLDRLGLRIPLVADIHFLPEAAMKAAEFADKVRINPGNYADRKVFELKAYTDGEYQSELERIAERFTPLVLKLKQHGRAMRIGTNHGSLSDRIMGRFGDSPEGMVESALEFVRICRALDYHEIILSMKASSPATMIAANRLLVARMDREGMDYPIHLGVTEAGDGEDGRIKSAIGIGSLLEDGIGDTVRVSLTEDPECEVPVAFELVRKYNERAARPEVPSLPAPSDEPLPYDPFAFSRRESICLDAGPVSLGGESTLRVEAACPLPPAATREAADFVAALAACPRFHGDPQPKARDGHEGVEIFSVAVRDACDIEALRAIKAAVEARGIRVAWALRIPADAALAQLAVGVADQLNMSWPDADGAHTEDEARAVADVAASSGLALQWSITPETAARFACAHPSASGACAPAQLVRRLADWSPADRTIFSIEGPALIADTRHVYAALSAIQRRDALLLRAATDGSERGLIECSVALGSLLCDGIGDAVEITGTARPSVAALLAYNILQGAGRRITKTEFISCPSCGRTLFDLQTTTERIKSQTRHLKNVRIAIMGCIVNGPGEMADADFGYVGAGTRRISLYVGKNCVERDVPELIA